jgi:hypothetical protein
MEINEALTQFQSDKKGKYSAKDLDAISEVVSELNLSGFEVRLKSNVVTKSGKPYPIYIRDADDIVHFHPWMIVSRKRFKRCDPTQNSRYKTWPYFLMLDGWITSSVQSDRPQCPKCFIEIPPTDICGMCELDLSDAE